LLKTQCWLHAAFVKLLEKERLKKNVFSAIGFQEIFKKVRLPSLE